MSKEVNFTRQVFNAVAQLKPNESLKVDVPVRPTHSFDLLANRICARLQSKNKAGEFNIGFKLKIRKNKILNYLFIVRV